MSDQSITYASLCHTLSQTAKALEPLDLTRADQKCKRLVEQIQAFEEMLDPEHEVMIQLASFGSPITMAVTSISYQNPDLLYFYGLVNGMRSQLIQHISQLNFLLCATERDDKSKPARRIGFYFSNPEDDAS